MLRLAFETRTTVRASKTVAEISCSIDGDVGRCVPSRSLRLGKIESLSSIAICFVTKQTTHLRKMLVVADRGEVAFEGVSGCYIESQQTDHQKKAEMTNT